MKGITKTLAGTAAAIMLASTSAQALDIGIGGGHGISADVGVSIGGGSGVSADVSANVGGSDGLGADVNASVGGSHGVNADVGVNSGSNDVGGTTTSPNVGTPTSATTQSRQMTSRSPATTSISKVKLTDMLGATVLTSDRKVVGMVENVSEGPNGTVDSVIRMNVAFGAERPTLRLRTERPTRDTGKLQLGYTRARLLSQIKG